MDFVIRNNSLGNYSEILSQGILFCKLTCKMNVITGYLRQHFVRSSLKLPPDIIP